MTRRLLVVEDDPWIRELLESILGSDELTFATSQVEAYRSLQSSEFDLVLLDLKLPRRPDDPLSDRTVGIEILRQIRRAGMKQRGSEMLLPVVVMTAHGTEQLSAELLVHSGANDYVAKPFGAGELLKGKIDIAVTGKAALVPASNIVGATIRVSFNDDQQIVAIETLEFDGATYALLKVLGDVFVEDQSKLLSVKGYRHLSGHELANILGTEEATIRRRVSRLRKHIGTEFRRELGRALPADAIVENKPWHGYRLNPCVVRVLAWTERPRSRAPTSTQST